MTEFGHIAGSVADFHIDSWGAGPFTITIGKTVYRFEDSDRFGPHLVDKAGNPLKDDAPGARSPFWAHYSKWVASGRKVAADGESCVYDTPKPGIYRRDENGRRWIVEENDADIGAGWVEARNA